MYFRSSSPSTSRETSNASPNASSSPLASTESTQVVDDLGAPLRHPDVIPAVQIVHEGPHREGQGARIGRAHDPREAFVYPSGYRSELSLWRR